MPLGLLKRQPFLIYTGLMVVVSSTIPVSGPDTSFRTVLGFVGFVALSLFAFAETGEYSWLVMTAFSVAGLCGVYLVRRHHQHLAA